MGLCAHTQPLPQQVSLDDHLVSWLVWKRPCVPAGNAQYIPRASFWTSPMSKSRRENDKTYTWDVVGIVQKINSFGVPACQPSQLPCLQLKLLAGPRDASRASRFAMGPAHPRGTAST